MPGVLLPGGGSSSGSKSKPGFKYPTGKGDFQDLYKQILTGMPTSMPSLESLIAGGVNSPLLSAILEPALARLLPAEQAARDAMTDQFRAAGGLRSGAYAAQIPELEGELMSNRSSLISEIIAKTLGTLVPGQLQEQRNLFMPTEALSNLLNITKPMYQGPTGSMAGGGGFSAPGPRSGSIGQSVAPNIFNTPYINPAAEFMSFGGGGGGGSPYSGGGGTMITPDLSWFDWGNTPDPYAGQGAGIIGGGSGTYTPGYDLADDSGWY